MKRKYLLFEVNYLFHCLNCGIDKMIHFPRTAVGAEDLEKCVCGEWDWEAITKAPVNTLIVWKEKPR